MSNTRELARQQKQMASLRKEAAGARAAFSGQAEYDRARAMLEGAPQGAKHLAAYLHDGEIVVLDAPPDEDDDPECQLHNCDEMGCGWCHVAARIPHPYRAAGAAENAVSGTKEETSE